MLLLRRISESVAMTYALAVAPVDHQRPTIVPKYRQFSGYAPWCLCIKVASLEWLADEFECSHLRTNPAMRQLPYRQDLESV